MFRYPVKISFLLYSIIPDFSGQVGSDQVRFGTRPALIVSRISESKNNFGTPKTGFWLTEIKIFDYLKNNFDHPKNEFWVIKNEFLITQK
jgi:hypothetical protein